MPLEWRMLTESALTVFFYSITPFSTGWWKTNPHFYWFLIAKLFNVGTYRNMFSLSLCFWIYFVQHPQPVSKVAKNVTARLYPFQQILKIVLIVIVWRSLKNGFLLYCVCFGTICITLKRNQDVAKCPLSMFGIVKMHSKCWKAATQVASIISYEFLLKNILQSTVRFVTIFLLHSSFLHFESVGKGSNTR